MDLSDIILGIDLGTTFSAVAYVDQNGTASIIPNSQGEIITPSVVMLQDKKNDVIVGQQAKDFSELYPDRVIAFVKREMGKKPEEVRDGHPYFFWKKNLSPEEISSFILKQLKDDAENHLNTKLKNVVISVPAYFSDLEREATIHAGELAGLNVLRIINEPTAAALYYGLHKSSNNQKAFVFDLGGGTFDVIILQILESEIKVIGTDGDHKLGGVDWDNRIIDYVADQFLLEYGMDPREDTDAKADLCSRIERAKIQLSERDQTKIIVNAHGKKFSIDLARKMFDNLTSDLLERCNDLCRLVLEECKLNWNELDTIIPAGGSTRMPMVKNMLKKISGKEIRTDLVNPDECVALGAAIQG